MTISATLAERNADETDPTGQQVFEISGDDATRFLHAQLTSDVESQALGSYNWTSWLTPKGRVIAVLGIIRLDINHYLLIVPTSLASALAKRLKMFVMRSNVEIISQQWQQSFRTGDKARESLALCTLNEHRLSISNDRILVSLDNNRNDNLATENATNAFGVLDIVKASDSEVDPSSQRDWQRWCVSNGLPWIVEATSDSFIPQSLNLDAIGGLSFEKGCYPGQEIVARTHFKGRLKYRTAVLEFAEAQSLESGMKLTQPNDQARSATVLTVEPERRCVTAVVPVQWFEQPGEMAITTPESSEKSGDEKTTGQTRANLIAPPYELSLS